MNKDRHTWLFVQKHTIRLWIGLALLCWCGTIQSQELPVFELDSVKTYKQLSARFAAYWIDETAAADIDFLLTNEPILDFQPLKSSLPNLKKVFWIKWSLQNVMKEPWVVDDWILELGKGDYIDVYLVDSLGTVYDHQRVGELVPMSEKRLRIKHFVERIPLSLPTNEVVTMYVRLQRISGFPPALKLDLFQQDFYNRPGYRDKVPARWLFFGMMFTLAFLGIGLFPATKDKAFLYYGLFLLGMSGYMVDAFFNVYGNMFFFRERPKLVMFWVYGLVTLMNVAYIMFIREYIRSYIHFPKWDRAARIVVLVNLALGVLAWVVYGWTTDEFLTDKIIIPVIIATYFFLFTIIFPILHQNKWTIERFLMISSVALFTLAILINTISIFKGTNLRIVETQLILTLVILLFSVGLAFGLGYRLHQHQKEKQDMTRLRDLGEMKARFYQNITHEFRTPLTVISGVTDQLRQETSLSRFPQITRKLDMIKRSGKNLLNLVNDLLEMARLETGKVELTLGNGDIILYLRYLAESLDSFAVAKQVQLQFLTNLEGLQMDFDRERIRQVVYNLLSNAIKFSDDGGRVKMIVEQVELNNLPNLMVQIKDEGIGINKEDLKHIFDRFYQGKANRNIRYQGSGIGLALTKELVELMNGAIEMESQPGKGTTVKFHLPITNFATPFEDAANLQSIDTPVVSEDRSLDQAPESIFVSTEEQPLVQIVEDNPDVQDYLKSVLDNNYEVISASDGQQGLDMAIERIPDLIISDVMMPQKDGYELLVDLKTDERTCHIPVILLTAKNTRQDKLDGLTHGADAYLTKPFDQQELELRIRNLLDNRKKLQERWAQDHQMPKLAENGMSANDKAFLDTLTKFVIDHISDEDLDVARMQRAVHMSRPQLHRKLKALTGMSASRFRKRVRLEKAHQLLKEKTGTVTEIAYAVGYKHPSHFSSDFKAFFGVTPGQV